MDTRSLINYAKRTAPAWSRTDILNFINDSQDVIFGVPVGTMVYKDTATGMDKVLSTVAGTLAYELSASNFGADIQFIEAVYSLNMSSGYYGQSSAPTTGYSVKKAIGATNASILFSTDPGNSEFYIKCYKRPGELLTEDSELSVPSELIIPHLYRGVIGMIETVEHGESNAYERFLKEGVGTIRAQLNSEGTNLVYFTQGQGY